MNKLSIAIVCALVVCISAATLNIIDVYSMPVYNIAVLNNRKPVVAYFYNRQCKKFQSCEWVEPQLERVAKNRNEKLYLAKIDVDTLPQLAQLNGIQTYPTVILFKDGQIMDIVEGPKWGRIVKLVNAGSRL